uniref:Uncharacterized protein n=1 Tax=uncultured marine virus TaxID=186617 RepID=A0A0F7L9S5_9VIRU|nr:hypothetical protein [uncultured marine virus]
MLACGALLAHRETEPGCLPSSSTANTSAGVGGRPRGFALRSTGAGFISGRSRRHL